MASTAVKHYTCSSAQIRSSMPLARLRAELCCCACRARRAAGGGAALTPAAAAAG